MLAKLRAWWNRNMGALTGDRRVEARGKAQQLNQELEDHMEEAGVIGPPKGREGDGSA